MGIIVRNVPREKDEEILYCLAARQRGASWHALSKRFGRAPGSLPTSCRNVMEADLAESGEPVEVVRRAYR